MSGYGFSVGSSGYDDEDRLVNWQRSDTNLDQSWNLSAVGNWNSITENSSTQNRTHGPTHEMLTVASQSVTHDAKGNMTLIPAVLRPTNSGLPPTASRLTWDFENKLIAADTDNDSTHDIFYKFDALGRRVGRDDGTASVVYFQDGQQTIADYPAGTAAGSPTYTYVYASYIDEPVMRGGSGGLRYYHRNQQYSITAVSDGGGAIVECYAYSAYGQVTFADASGAVISDSAIANRYTYTGREWDEGLSLYHYRARMYDAVGGRFVSRDPIGFRGSKWNLYKFLGCKPLRYLDPLGLQDITFPPILIYPPNTAPPAPPIDWPVNPTGTGLLTGSCQQVKDSLRASMHPVIAKLLECNVNIFCGNCRGFDGTAMYFGPDRHGHICLDSSALRNQPIRNIEALVVHEGTHIAQYLEQNKCACKKTPYVGSNPPVPRGVGGADCDACEDAERPAYHNQAEYLYPPHLPDAQAYYDTVIDWGLCYSCASPCGGDRNACGPFPEVPFPLLRACSQ